MSGTSNEARRPSSSAGVNPKGDPKTAEVADAEPVDGELVGDGPAGDAGGPAGDAAVGDDGPVEDAVLVEDTGHPGLVEDPGSLGDSQTTSAGGAASAPDGASLEELFKLTANDDLSGLETLLSDDFGRISAERDEFLDALKRLQADFDNFRKRTERQQTELRGRASESLVVKLLPVLDSLELAMAHLGLGDAAPTDEAAAALLQVNGQLRDILQREGLERIDAVGVGFDPTVHEATAVDDSEPAAGTHTDVDMAAGPIVTEVWRSGYRMGDRVIRPAMVRVRG